MLPGTRSFLSLFKRMGYHKADYSTKLSEKPLGNLFFHPKVQFFMQKLTTVDYDHIFRLKKVGKLFTPVYKFMTDEELKGMKKKFAKMGNKLLQPPPIIDITDDKTEELSLDFSLDGHDKHHSKHVFIDISFDLEPHERFIVVREPNGVLRTASKNERHRMNQIYFPMEGREIFTPKMFEPEHLKRVLDRGEYEFVLDRACIQFEPDEEQFHSVLVNTFDRVDKENDFDKLCKTRHFGPLAFYLAINKRINNMLRYFMENRKLTEACYLVNFLHLVNSESRELPGATDNEDISFDDACKTVKDYISDPLNKAMNLDSVYNAMVEKLKEEEIVKSELLKAHGV